MPTYSSFAVTGAGDIGSRIVEALLAKGVKVVILTRPPSASRTFPAGAAIEEVNYESVESVAEALKKHDVEVVISTLNNAAFSFQNLVADAAKAAGVKLFVPSEFGMPTAGSTESLFRVKDEFAQYLKSIGIPSARFFVGAFGSQVTWLTGYASNGKINIAGKGETPATFTAEEDIAGFVAHVLTEQPASVSQDRIFRIQGNRHTLKELADIFNTEAVHVEKVPGPQSEITTFLQQHIEIGHGSTGWDNVARKEGEEPAGSSNNLWEGHHWKTLKEIHNL